MNYANIKATSIRISHEAKLLNITQEEISIAIGVSQSQVSRVFSGNSKRASRVFLEICNYVDSKRIGVSPELVRENDELIQALTTVWDGSFRQSKALAGVILALGGLCSPSNQK